MFATTREAAARAVGYVRTGTGLPAWLFALVEPDEQTASQCERVVTGTNAFGLWLRAQCVLWREWVALGVADWTGSRGNWPLKLAPLSLPPFRALLLNENGDFFASSPGHIWIHARRRMREKLFNSLQLLRDVTRGGALYCFAFVAQFHSGVSRFAFRRVKGTRPLKVSTTPAGQGIERFSYKGRMWHVPAIAELVATSDARWILFQREDFSGDVADLAPLFDDPRTFAVSRQVAVRSWRKLLFATAPFRALQSDAAAQVFAPISPQMLVDRAKLAALGVPELSSFGSNWMVLFWQAAAAGWRSYSVGGGPKPTELVGVPLEDAEFVKLLFERRDLRELAPREPSLARGAIGRPASRQPLFRGLPRVLVVSPYLPYPLSHGGAVRIYNLCRVLSDRIDFVLACFREKDDIVDYGKLHEIFREVYAVDVDEKHANPDLPKQVNGYESASMRALIANLCREKQIDLLQVEYTQMAAYREAAPDVPAILVEHDLTFTLYKQLADREKTQAARAEYQRWLAFERERLGAYDTVWTMSDFDRGQAVAEGSPANRTLAIPNGVDLRKFTPSDERAEAQEILYVGSFRHLPNYLGFEELRREIMPLVWREFPGATLRVVAGPEHEKYWSGPRELDARITIHGFVEQVAPLYAEATLVAVPLPVSAGTNIKVMEALSCARTVVTTPVGCAGLGMKDGLDAMIRDLGAPFAQAICELLRDATLRRNIACNGRKTAEERFSWESIGERAYECYEKLLIKSACG